MNQPDLVGTTELIPAPAPLSRLTPQTYQLIALLAPSFHSCRWFGISDPGQAIVLMAKAADLGIPVTSAFEYFDIIEGKPAIKPLGAAALIQRSGMVQYTVEDGKDFCTISGRRRDNGFAHSVTYTLAEAEAAGLVKKDKAGSAWNRFQRDMLYNRCMGRFARRLAPDLLGGLYLTSELEQPDFRDVTPCDHFMAVAGDPRCPGCGATL